MTGHAAPFRPVPAVPRFAPEPAGRHVAQHVHEFVTVAEFAGIRASIGECACGDTRTIWRTPEPVVYEVDELCRWFALCTRPATQLVPHPILGDVPACDECAARAAL